MSRSTGLDGVNSLVTWSRIGFELMKHEVFVESHVHVGDSLRHCLGLPSKFGFLPFSLGVHLKKTEISWGTEVTRERGILHECFVQAIGKTSSPFRGAPTHAPIQANTRNQKLPFQVRSDVFNRFSKLPNNQT